MPNVLNKDHAIATNLIAYISGGAKEVSFDEIRIHFGWTNEQAPDSYIQAILEAYDFPVVEVE